MNFKDYIRVIPDFPQPGIRFKDITTLLQNGPVYKEAIEQLKQLIQDKEIDVIAGPEARGFVIGAPLAYCTWVWALFQFVKAANCLAKRSKLIMRLNTAKISLLCTKMRLSLDRKYLLLMICLQQAERFKHPLI